MNSEVIAVETVIVVLILAASVTFAVRSLLRALGGRSGCGGACDGCTMKCREEGKDAG